MTSRINQELGEEALGQTQQADISASSQLHPTGAPKGYLDPMMHTSNKTLNPTIEPITPTGGAVPSMGAVPTTAQRPRGSQLSDEEERSYHDPYKRDIRHGEQLFPAVKGHEGQIYEEAEGYASPDDVAPEVLKKVEQHEKYGWTEEDLEHTHAQAERARRAVPARAGTEEHKRYPSSDVTAPTSDATTTTRKGTTSPQGGLISAVQTAARVTAERVSYYIGSAKEAVGVPRDKPLLHAAKEAVGLEPEMPVTQAVREGAAHATQHTRQVSVERWQATKNSVVEAPTKVKEMYEEGKRLASERDRAHAEEHRGTEAGMADQRKAYTHQAFESQGQPKGQSFESDYRPHVTLPIDQQMYDQSLGGKAVQRHIEKTARGEESATKIDESGRYTS